VCGSVEGAKTHEACGWVRCKPNRRAPVGSRYRESRWVKHDWRCSACGNEWTSTRV
jgi:hypothetical protein